MRVTLGGRLGPLHERPFRLLFGGRMLSAVGDGIVPVALTFAVLEIGTATDLGYVFAAFMGARVLSVVAGGVWADRLPRQVVMIAADAVRGIVQGTIAIAFFTDAIEVWQLALSSALFGIAAAFFNPASTALVPEVVSPPRSRRRTRCSACRTRAAMRSRSNGLSALNAFSPVEPMLFSFNTGLGLAFMFLGRLDLAIHWASEALTMSQRFQPHTGALRRRMRSRETFWRPRMYFSNSFKLIQERRYHRFPLPCEAPRRLRCTSVA